MVAPSIRKGQEPPPKPADSLARETEETFVSCLGWGLVKSVDNPDRWIPYISEGIGLDPACIVNGDVREIYRAIREHYLEHEAFTWQAVRSSLLNSGWFGKAGSRTFVYQHATYTDIVCNQFTSIGALPTLRRQIEEAAEKRSRQGVSLGGWA